MVEEAFNMSVYPVVSLEERLCFMVGLNPSTDVWITRSIGLMTIFINLVWRVLFFGFLLRLYIENEKFI